MSDKNSFDSNVNSDSGIDIDLTDLEDISLDELDSLDGIDLDNLDLDDIDFDDLDVTNLDTGIGVKNEKVKVDEAEEDFDFDELIKEQEKQNKTNAAKQKQEKKSSKQADDSEDVFAQADEQMQEDISEPSNEDLDALFDSFGNDNSKSDDNQKSDSKQKADNKDDDLEESLEDITNDLEDMSDEDDYTKSEGDLDDLFNQSMELSFEDGDLDDIQDITDMDKKPEKGKKGKKAKKKKKSGAADDTEGAEDGPKKKSFSEFLFGEPDADDLEEARLLEEKKANKEIAKAKKAEEKAEKEAKKKEEAELKQREAEAKKKEKADLKAEKDAEYQAELEAEKEAKKVPTVVVIIVFALFAALGAFVILGTKSFDYSQVIKKATDYFNRQRYSLAYDEIAGVDVKKKDEDLRDRIYTVMYVERLYESYENNMTLNRADKALDALVRGLEKYDEHYDEAVELDIVSDIDSCKANIVKALSETYNLTEEQADEIGALEGSAYTEALKKYSDGVGTN